MGEPLYSKYRPERIEDLVGQDMISRKLDGFLKQDVFPRAILIAGPTGLGKTTVARMIARYLNCEHRDKHVVCADTDGDPCKSCLLLSKNPPMHPNYKEQNASDERGIDATRDAVLGSSMMPQQVTKTRGYRVICLDEAQGLTPQAAQVLLKPLEEPPRNTVWIIATMMPGKLPQALRDRCQKLEMRRLTTDNLVEVQKRALKGEGITAVSDPILTAIAEASLGSPRAALSALDGVLAVLRAKGSLDESALPKLLEEVVRFQPEVVARKFVCLALVGKASVLNNISKVENHVTFLNMVREMFEDFLFRQLGAGERVVGPDQWVKYKNCYQSSRLADYALMHRLITEAYDRAASYAVDPASVVDSLTLQLLAITTKWNE